MIIVEDVYKQSKTELNTDKWLLRGVSLTIPRGVSVGIVGHSADEKSALLRLIGGIESATQGKIVRHSFVSWPMGFAGGLQVGLTGRQNARFICRVHGQTKNIEERLAYIQSFSELERDFDKPLKTYSGNMKQQLLFSIFIASEFDIYLSDVGVATGNNREFKKKATDAFKAVTENAGLVMTGNDAVLEQFCRAGIWLHEGQAYWFDDIQDALNHYKESANESEK